MVQFAILGTFGEMLSRWVVKRRVHLPFNLKMVLWKMVVWAIMAICIKYAFAGFKGFVHGLVDYGMVPSIVETNRFLWAFSVSVATNLQFGLFLVVFHRILDNLVEKEKNWQGLGKGMLSMIWFWIPAHTITFMLPGEFQIGLAAVWSLVLGVLLGLFNRSK